MTFQFYNVHNYDLLIDKYIKGHGPPITVFEQDPFDVRKVC